MASTELFKHLISEVELLTPSVKSVYSGVLNSLLELSLDQIWDKQSSDRASNENRFIIFCILLKIEISGIDLWEQVKTYIENAIHIINDLTNQQENVAKVIDIILCRVVQKTEKLSEVIEICQNANKLKNILKTLTILQSANHQALITVLKEISGRESNLFYDDYINLLNNIITLKSLGVEFFYDSYSVINLAVNFLLNQNTILLCKPERNMEKEIILFNLIKKFNLDKISNENIDSIKQNYPAEELKVSEVINPMLSSIKRDEISWDGHPKNQKKIEGKNLISYIYKGNYKSKTVCIKIYIEITPNQGDFSVAEKEIEIYEILSKLSSENCFLVYYGTCIFKDNNTKNVALVMQWVDKSLAKYIDDLSKPIPEKPIPEKLLKKIYTKLLNSYHVLRNYNIYHLDVKPQNILIDDSDCNNLKLYIIDFDVSELDIIARTKSVTINSKAVGTVNYAHPNIRKALYKGGIKFIREYHRSDADIYSLGMTFLHLALLKNFKDKLNKDKNHEKLKEAINSIKFYWAKDLITEMLKSKDKNATSIGRCKCFLPCEKTSTFSGD
ncbi:hypothetical protein SteCoe_38539 [Stentor coeruleus]|uniref:mitogen-activated protein kinase kinase n=1 Tax=Stentor coeruleus TaxID=5963 RepID=A0A1R2ALA9_9CILI|nr:hypothetical protein SteCoe_38539 [Stentor coeruleus]